MVFAQIVIWLLLLAAPVAVFISWLTALRESSRQPILTIRVGALLVLLSASLLWLICGYFWPPLLGPNYSRFRYSLLYGNSALMALTFALSAWVVKPLKVPLMSAALFLAIDWVYVAMINAAI
jgi:hypothetical protein